MKAIHLSAYGNPDQNARRVAVPRPIGRLLAGNACVRFRNRSGSVG
jgi:hypothetical protein